MGLLEWTSLLGNVGEFVGSIAVLATLIYLAIQLRENTRTIRIQALGHTFSRRDTLLSDMQSLQGVGNAYRKTFVDANLSEDDLYELSILFLRICLVNEELYHLHRQGAVDDFNLASFERQLAVFFRNSHFETWWPQSRIQFSNEFQRHVEAIKSDA